MGYWKLTDQVTWGDVDSLKEIGDRMGSVISLANQNDEMRQDDYNVLDLDPKVHYFRIARDDHDPVDDDYMFLLDGVVDLVIELELFPVLVHCYAGTHRSPAVATYIAQLMSGDRSLEHLERLQAKVRRLRGKPIRENWEFYESLIKRLKEGLL